MAETVTVQEAQQHLPDLIAKLDPESELVITEGGRPVAKLVGPPVDVQAPRQPGSAKHQLTLLSEDDEHLEDFHDYLS